MLAARGVAIVETSRRRGEGVFVNKTASLSEDVSNIWGVDLPRGTRFTMARKGVTIRVPGIAVVIRSKAALVEKVTRDPPAARPVTRTETLNRAVTMAQTAQADAANARQQRNIVEKAMADIFSIAAPFVAPTTVPPERDATCKICMDHVIDRFVTTCGHVACGGCLQNMIAQRPGNQTIQCPFCMSPFGLEDIRTMFIA